MGESPSRSEVAFDRLKQMILRFELRPGEVLVERRLEELLGVSRTSARAALNRLEHEGLVRRGVYQFAVTPIDVTELEEAYDFRILVELEALRLAMKKRDELCEELDALLAQMEAGEDLADPEWMQLSTEFHYVPAHLSDNRFLVEGLQRVLPRISRARLLEVSEARSLGHEEHRQIVEFLRGEDLESAQGLLQSHLNRSRDRLLETISSLGIRLAAQGMELV